MLKIKDDVDLRILKERYNFFDRFNNKLPDNSFSQKDLDDTITGQMCFRLNNRELFHVGSLDLMTAELLYDLIIDGLVEKE